MAVVAYHDLELHQMDVKTAFLNSELDEEIYMKQPESFLVQGHEDKVYKLQKELYGLKQSSRQWYKKLHHAISEISFVPNSVDICFYVKRNGSNYLYLSLYVDDILITGDDLDAINGIKQWLKSTFKMKDMDEAKYVLGIKITYDRLNRLLTLSHESYLETVLKRFDMIMCQPVDIPISKSEKLSSKRGPMTKEDKAMIRGKPYAQIVRSIMHTMLYTGPDVAFAMGLVSRFLSNPGLPHQYTVKRIVWYIKCTLKL